MSSHLDRDSAFRPPNVTLVWQDCVGEGEYFLWGDLVPSILGLGRDEGQVEAEIFTFSWILTFSHSFYW